MLVGRGSFARSALRDFPSRLRAARGMLGRHERTVVGDLGRGRGHPARPRGQLRPGRCGCGAAWTGTHGRTSARGPPTRERGALAACRQFEGRNQPTWARGNATTRAPHGGGTDISTWGPHRHAPIRPRLTGQLGTVPIASRNHIQYSRDLEDQVGDQSTAFSKLASSSRASASLASLSASRRSSTNAKHKPW